MTPKDPTELRKELEHFKKTHDRRHGLNFHADWIVVVVSMVAMGMISIIGIFQWWGPDSAKVMAAISVVNALIIGVHRLGNFQERAEFQRLAATEAENLLTQFDYLAQNEADLKSIVERLQSLRDHTARELPKGEGIKVAVQLLDELAKLRSKATRDSPRT